ncbi:MAG: 4-hydroxy-tetrahydrodipicolinate synthase [Deltaproteobacteria bacterium]|nr:4-hydroxy-tetrahydrodipicolinate synthase [Deltaproteobacteria bacterium]MBW2446815.1 4-hydroxy-tetrahydrodipicolinate synthase [Deltaproteobacteria bacterium]
MFEGVHTALVTPFRDGDGSVDEAALRALVERQVAAGVDGLVPCGSTGESATLSHAEHRRVVEVVVEAARGRVQVIAGTGSNNTREAIELTHHAKEAGADGALLISPYYNKPTQHGIVEHFSTIARECSFPLVVYNIPGRTASNIEPETMARLSDVEQIVGVKEACGDLHQMSQAIAASSPDFTFLSGDDAMTLPLLAIGGHGVITTVGNLVPAEMVELVQAYKGGDLDRARSLHYRVLPLIDAIFRETNPIPVKAAVAMQGLISEGIRLPLTPISSEGRESLRLLMKEFGLL